MGSLVSPVASSFFRETEFAASTFLNFHWCSSSSQFSLGSQEELEKRTTYHMESEEMKKSKSARKRRKSGQEDTDSAKSGEFDDEDSGAR